MADSLGSSSVSCLVLTTSGECDFGYSADSEVTCLVLTTSGECDFGYSADSEVTCLGVVSSGECVQSRMGLSAISSRSLLLLPSGTGDAGGTGQSAQALPMLSAFGAVANTVPILAFEIKTCIGVLGRVAASELVVPDMVATSAGATSFVAYSVQDVLMPVSVASSNSQRIGDSKQDNLILTPDGAGITGRQGVSLVQLPMVETVSLGTSSVRNGSAQTLPLIEFSSSGLTSRLATAALTLPLITGKGSGVATSMAVSEIELPMWSASGQGASLKGVSVLVLPALIAQGFATNNAAIDAGMAGATGVSYAMHTQTKALVQDANNRFNSYATHGTVMLAANEDGLFVLGASTDAGVRINSSMALPVSDLDDAQLKRVSQMTVGYRSDGRLLLTVMTDDGRSVSYTMEAVLGAKCQPNRVKIGRGSKSRYWEFGISNIGGCDHAIDKLDVDWQILSRRVP